jgi:hypothetical protein
MWCGTLNLWSFRPRDPASCEAVKPWIDTASLYRISEQGMDSFLSNSIVHFQHHGGIYVK